MHKLEKNKLSEDENNRLLGLVDKVNWRKAGQKYDRMGLSHSYLVRAWNAPVFDALSEAVLQNGYEDQFGRQTLTYMVIGDFKYWVMGNVLNREPVRATVLRAKKKGIILEGWE